MASFAAPGNAGLDDSHLVFPAVEIFYCVANVGAVGVLSRPEGLLLFEFAIQPGQRGDGVEDPPWVKVVERLGEQVSRWAGTH